MPIQRSMPHAKRIGVLVVLVLAVVALYQFTPARYYLSAEGLNELKN